MNKKGCVHLSMQMPILRSLYLKKHHDDKTWFMDSL
jgi:hypothetical protein